MGATIQPYNECPGTGLHEVENGDGVCGDCLWCQENAENDCIVPSDPKCAWCGHCLGNHADQPAAKQGCGGTGCGGADECICRSPTDCTSAIAAIILRVSGQITCSSGPPMTTGETCTRRAVQRATSESEPRNPPGRR